MNAMRPPPPKSLIKPPLITPSASPPPARLPYRISDSASPTKRQRLNSTPRRTPSEPSSSAGRQQFPEDVQQEREASKMRLFDVWSSLAERYTIPVEDDDIVNIQTGEITRDNGYLRKSRKLDFGAIAAPALGNIAADDSSEEDEEDEYDLDELDAFADVSESSYYEAETQADADLSRREMPPPMVLTAADAEDLREFMDAERRRRELCGSDLDEEEEEEEEGYFSAGIEHTGTRIIKEGSRILSATEYAMSGEEDEDELGTEEEKTSAAWKAKEKVDDRVPRNMDSRVTVDIISEDELDNWNVDDASVVHPRVKSEQTSDHGYSDSEIEIIEDTTELHIVEQSHTQKSPTKLYSNPQICKPLQQLYTPPLSHSSSRPSATPFSDVIDLSIERSPPLAPSIRTKTPKIKFDTPRDNNRFSPTHTDVEHTPVRRMDRSQLVKDQEKNSPSKLLSEVSLKSRTKSGKPKFKTQAFVLLTPRRGSSRRKADPTSSAPSSGGDSDSKGDLHDHDNISLSKLSKGKGKATEPASDANWPGKQHSSAVSRTGKARQETKRDVASSNNDSDHESISIKDLPSKSPRFGVPRGKHGTTKRTPKDTKTPNGKTALLIHERVSLSSQSDYPPPRSPPIHRKRKRVVSDARADFQDGALQNPKTGSSPQSPQKSDRSSTCPSTSRPITDNGSKSLKPKKRSSSKRRQSSRDSGSSGGYDTQSSESELGDRYQHSKSHSRVNASLQPPPHHPYHNMSYPPIHYPPHNYQHLPDTRAQLIISQAMQQLSALVGAAWAPPHHYMDGSVPSTPHRRHDGRQMNGPFITPTHHPHPYPYAYDPNLSNATLPPDSPEYNSSPSKSISGRRKSLVGRSRSRGRRVSFNIEQDIQSREEMETDGYSSPTSTRLPKGPYRGGSSRIEGTKKTGGQKQKREKTPGRKFRSPDEDDSDIRPEVERLRGKAYARDQTPGPCLDSKEEGSSRGRARQSKRHEKR